jgi:trehalose 6-phosphate synthase
VRVNPYDFPGTADAMAAALAMSEAERAERMRRLRAAVRRHRVGLWQSSFLAALETTTLTVQQRITPSRSVV